MCQMKVHASAQTTTMLQALAHNLATSVADLETVRRVLRGRGEGDNMLGWLGAYERTLTEVHAGLLNLFEDAVTEHPHVAQGHRDDTPVGEERVGNDMAAITKHYERLDDHYVGGWDGEGLNPTLREP